MGYEIAGGLGVRMAQLAAGATGSEVFVLVGDGSYLMMAQELVTAVAEGVKLIVVLVQNHGYASIGALSETVGVNRFGTWYRYRDPRTGAFDGDRLPVDLAANAASLGADVLVAATVDELRSALAKARQSTRTTVVHVETDPLAGAPPSQAWWDVPVAEIAATEGTAEAREAYLMAKRAQRRYLYGEQP
jgi:3D-(3,5/4)-trihydroxycyclohexane-1,2-dione acylhydrolase (decyclizing)